MRNHEASPRENNTGNETVVNEFLFQEFGVKLDTVDGDLDKFVSLLNAKRVLEQKLLTIKLAELKAVSNGIHVNELADRDENASTIHRAVLRAKNDKTLEDIQALLKKVKLVKNHGSDSFSLDLRAIDLGDDKEKEILKFVKSINDAAQKFDEFVTQQYNEAIERKKATVFGLSLLGITATGLLAGQSRDMWMPAVTNALSAQTFSSIGDKITGTAIPDAKNFFLDSFGPKMSDAARTVGAFCHSYYPAILISVGSLAAAVTISAVIIYALSSLNKNVAQEVKPKQNLSLRIDGEFPEVAVGAAPVEATVATSEVGVAAAPAASEATPAEIPASLEIRVPTAGTTEVEAAAPGAAETPAESPSAGTDSAPEAVAAPGAATVATSEAASAAAEAASSTPETAASASVEAAPGEAETPARDAAESSASALTEPSVPTPAAAAAATSEAASASAAAAPAPTAVPTNRTKAPSAERVNEFIISAFGAPNNKYKGIVVKGGKEKLEQLLEVSDMIGDYKNLIAKSHIAKLRAEHSNLSPVEPVRVETNHFEDIVKSLSAVKLNQAVGGSEIELDISGLNIDKDKLKEARKQLETLKTEVTKYVTHVNEKVENIYSRKKLAVAASLAVVVGAGAFVAQYEGGELIAQANQFFHSFGPKVMDTYHTASALCQSYSTEVLIGVGIAVLALGVSAALIKYLSNIPETANKNVEPKVVKEAEREVAKKGSMEHGAAGRSS